MTDAVEENCQVCSHSNEEMRSSFWLVDLVGYILTLFLWWSVALGGG